jgi:cell division protein FtsQ
MRSIIKTNQSWKRHVSQRPQKVQRGYYGRQKNNQQKLIVRIILGILFLLLAQSVFQIKYLKIDNIELSGNNDLSIEEVQDFVLDELTVTKLLVFENSNYFLMSLDKLDDKLIAQYNLDSVNLQKKWPDTLQISVKEKSSHFIWQKDESIYLLDAKGLLNRQISILDDKYLVLDDKRESRPSGEQIFDDSEINIINQIYLNWMDLIASKSKLNKITISNNWDLELHTEIGFYVKIDRAQDIYEQLNNLRAVLEENIAGVDIDYIDVRFGDKVYFK